jgi:SAM-dependent methyltransferase
MAGLVLSDDDAAGRPSCLACGSSLPVGTGFAAVDRFQRTAGTFSVAICAVCGSGTTLPLVPAEALHGYYPAGYGPYDGVHRGALQLVSRAIRSWIATRTLRAFPIGTVVALGPSTGIDVGCGAGDLAASLIDRGWRMSGVEPSAGAASWASARGVEVHVGTMADAPFDAGRFDAAVLQQALEHTIDPRGDLQRLREMLRAGALVAISVPNFGGWQARRMRSRWFHLDVPRHRVHFTPDGLSRVLTQAGFERIEVRSGTSAIGLPASLQYALAGRCLFPSGLPLNVASGLAALTMPIAIMANRAGGGDLLHAVAYAPA